MSSTAEENSTGTGAIGDLEKSQNPRPSNVGEQQVSERPTNPNQPEPSQQPKPADDSS